MLQVHPIVKRRKNDIWRISEGTVKKMHWSLLKNTMKAYSVFWKFSSWLILESSQRDFVLCLPEVICFIGNIIFTSCLLSAAWFLLLFFLLAPHILLIVVISCLSSVLVPEGNNINLSIPINMHHQSFWGEKIWMGKIWKNWITVDDIVFLKQRKSL